MNDPLDRTFETAAGDPPPAFLDAVASRRRRRRAARCVFSAVVFAIAVIVVLRIPPKGAGPTVPAHPIAMHDPLDALPIAPVDDGSIAFGRSDVPRLGDGLGLDRVSRLTDPF